MQQNISYGKPHHIFDIKIWCSCHMQQSEFAFPACLSYDSCHHNKSRFDDSMKVSLFTQALQVDHKFQDNGMLHNTKIQANLSISRQVLYLIAKHFEKSV